MYGYISMMFHTVRIISKRLYSVLSCYLRLLINLYLSVGSPGPKSSTIRYLQHCGRTQGYHEELHCTPRSHGKVGDHCQPIDAH